MRPQSVLGEMAALLSRQGIRGQRQQLRFFASSQQAFRAQNTTSSSTSPLLRLFSRNAHRPSVRHLLSRQRGTQRRLLSDKPDISSSKSYNPTKNLGSPGAQKAENLSLSQRLKKLSREYGWSALGVYFALSALDFPFCFLAVRLIGTERIGYLEHKIVGFVKRAIPFQLPEKWGGQGRLSTKEDGEESVAGLTTGYDHGVKEAEQKNSGDNASIWTQLALAYAVHKSFIFIRIPLTAAVTPRVVKTLRGWGWNIGKRTPKSNPSVSSSGN